MDDPGFRTVALAQIDHIPRADLDVEIHVGVSGRLDAGDAERKLRRVETDVLALAVQKLIQTCRCAAGAHCYSARGLLAKEFGHMRLRQ